MSDGDNENIPVLPEKQSEENGENVLNTSFENEDENVGEDSLIRSFEKQESDDEDNLIRSFEKQESDDEDDLIRSFETQNEEDEQVKPMESIPEVTEPFPSPPKRLSSPPKRSLYKTPSPETSMEAPDHGIRKSPRLRSANVEEQSQPAKSVVSISKVTETVPASPLKRAIRKTPSRESSMEAPEVGNRKSPRSRKTSVSIEERPQAAKLMEPIPEVTEHFQASPRKRSVRKTPSRESSIDAPEVGRRKSPRSKKSSVNVEDKLQPAKLMEPIPEVTEHFPASPRKRPVRKTSSRESSMEAPDISSRKSPRSRKSSVNVEDKLQPAKSMEPIPEVTEHFPASPRKRPVRKTPSRESSMDAPEVGRRKSPRKSSISVEQAKPMEPITEVSEVLSSFTEEWRQKNRRPPLTKRVIRKTPSRESSMEAPDLRKSPRLRKSSSNVEERSQPVASMESIAEVSETPNRTRGRPKKH
uniref:Uncharacterized protein n=1 Tax=Panagrolaimus davidi TaxID=227884 RepID=A0A914P755_9BILA